MHIEDLFEVNRVKGLGRGAEDAVSFRAKLLGLIYEDLLAQWLQAKGYDDMEGVRRGVYEGEKFAVDFVLEKGGKRLVVEAKGWPSYLGGRLKKLDLKTLEAVRKMRGLKKLSSFLEKDFLTFGRRGDQAGGRSDRNSFAEEGFRRGG